MTGPIFPEIDATDGHIITPSTDSLYQRSATAVRTTGDQSVGGIKTHALSPIFPTPTAGDNTTKAATTAFVQTAVDALPTSSVEEIQDLVASLLVAGSGTTLTYDDTAGTLTISTAGVDAEAVRDTMAAALVAAGLISIVVDDTANTITIATSATANQTDSYLLNLANHTGQIDPATDILGFDAAVQNVVGTTDSLLMGGVIVIRKVGANWKTLDGVTTIVRPTPRTDVMVFAITTDGVPPSFLISGFDLVFSVPA